MPSQTDRPRYRFSADRTSARRRVRYVEGNHPNESGCGLCQLDELIQTNSRDHRTVPLAVTPAANDPLLGSAMQALGPHGCLHRRPFGNAAAVAAQHRPG